MFCTLLQKWSHLLIVNLKRSVDISLDFFEIFNADMAYVIVQFVQL